MQLTVREKKAIIRRYKQGETQMDLAAEYTAKGFEAPEGGPVRNYTISYICNQRKIKARARARYARLNVKTKTTKPVVATPRTNPDIESFMLDTLAARSLTTAQKVKVLTALLD